MAKERRCNLFDDHGRPRRLKDGTRGCFRDASACRFAHPHEREWESAHPSHPPKHGDVVDSDSDFFYILAPPERRDWEKERRDRERDRKPYSLIYPDSPPHRRQSVTNRTSPGPSRKSTLDSPMDGTGTTKRPKSPALSVCSDQLELLRKDSKYRTKDLPPLRQDYAAPVPCRSLSGDKGRERERVDMPTQMPHVQSHTATSMLPPEPIKPPPVQPPPPLPSLLSVPDLPPFVSGQHPPSSVGTGSKGLKDLSMDEQRSAWHDRINLLFTSIASRRDYTKLESDLNQIRLLSKSSLASNMLEADRANMNSQKIALELQMEVKRKEVNDVIQKLIGSVFWPVLRTPEISEMEKTLGETKKHVLEVRNVLDDVKNSCAALLKTSTSDWPQDSDRPSKRRKLEGKAGGSGQPTGGDQDVAEDTTKELEAFRDKLTEFDRHLIDLENDIIQRDKIISDEIELHIDARLEEEDALYPPVREPGEISPSEIEAIVDAKNKEIVHAVTVAGEDIGALATEVAELITKVNGLEARCKALEAENYEFKNKLSQNTLNHGKSQDALGRRDKEIEAIAAALQAYISQAPASPTASDLPSAEYIMKALDSQLDGLFRDKFCATMVGFQRDVFDKVQETHNRTVDAIAPKIVLLLKMVNLITARIGMSDRESG